ncbi:hypothetical protein [Paradevosia shaoguanensis]|uniref:hypothetical protein n=1 Tax=Paradevosia shaoguanensis TaxID=1335043 RepID=UPI0015FC230E|nr:hypothetical protein GHV40_11565 [Devosia sp. D6-9]
MDCRLKTAGALLLALAGSVAVAGPGFAQSIHDTDSASLQTLFVFGGRYYSEYIENGINPFKPAYENNYIVGAGYQRFLPGSWHYWRLGLEVGLAARLGDSTSAEMWAGAVARFDGIVLGPVRISPALTLGVSAESGMVGIEAVHAQEVGGGDPALLFYMAPEINVSWTDNPNLEVFWRLQHRSGAWNTLGNMRDGANATTVGLRWKF